MEIHVQNATNQSAVTRTFIYHDTYFYFNNLEEQTDYIFYYYMKDLSGNTIDVHEYEFKTKNKQHPAIFSIVLKKDVDTEELRNKLAMLS